MEVTNGDDIKSLISAPFGKVAAKEAVVLTYQK